MLLSFRCAGSLNGHFGRAGAICSAASDRNGAQDVKAASKLIFAGLLPPRPECKKGENLQRRP